jgi:hypothetical protein
MDAGMMRDEERCIFTLSMYCSNQRTNDEGSYLSLFSVKK